MTPEQLEFSQSVQDRLDSIDNICEQCIKALQSQRLKLSAVVEDTDAQTVSLTQEAIDVLGSGEGTAGQRVLDRLNNLTAEMESIFNAIYTGDRTLQEIKDSVTEGTPIAFG